MFFQNAFGGGTPSALTSPGMSPQSLAMLMAMQPQGGAMGPQLPMLDKAPSNAAPAPNMQGPQPPPPQQDLLRMLMSMDPNKMKQWASMLGLEGGMGGGAGGGMMPGMGFGGMPGPGTGGLY